MFISRQNENQETESAESVEQTSLIQTLANRLHQVFTPIISIGLERSTAGFKAAFIEQKMKGFHIVRLHDFNMETEDVKPLYNHMPLLTTAISDFQTLIRPLHFPVTKEKDLLDALVFQAEPVLPYPVDEALLCYQIIEKQSEFTKVSLFAVRNEALQSHLVEWDALKIEPEKVSSVSWALSQFGVNFLPSHSTFLILHTQNKSMTCVLIKEGKLIASFSERGGLEFLNFNKDLWHKDQIPFKKEEWQACLQDQAHPLAPGLFKMQKSIAKMGFSLTKELMPSEVIEGIVVTGKAATMGGLDEILIKFLSLPLLECPSYQDYSSEQLREYAVPIGLAIASLPRTTPSIDFRQGVFAFPHPWKRLKIPFLVYFSAILLLSASFYFFGQHYLGYKEDVLKQNYVDMLVAMNKSYTQVETTYQEKNLDAKALYQGNIASIDNLSHQEIADRVAFLQKELQAIPDSFPLFVNTPRVSDVLAWLTHHEAILGKDENGEAQHRLQIESFNYIMVKRPQTGKKQEKYQVKIELEFSSPTPKWAREFHDALIKPNDWVDPKAEVKWNSTRDKYVTSFFLKDKTIYPGL